MWTQFVLTEFTISVVMIPGLLPIFLYGCEIRSWSDLETRLGTAIRACWIAFHYYPQRLKLFCHIRREIYQLFQY